MGLFKKTIYACALIFVTLFIISISVGYLGAPDLSSLQSSEKATIQQVSFDGADHSTILVNAQSTSSKTIIFSTAIVRNSEHQTIVAVCPIQTELPSYKNVTVAVDLNNILTSGNYTVTLETSKGNKFVSPLFNVQ
jgi:hypothetical protein